MEWLNNTKDFLLLDGRQLATQIRDKPDKERLWWEVGYLWFHDNFEKIIIIGGVILLALLIYNYFDEKGCSARLRVQQNGGQNGDPENAGNSSNSSSSPPKLAQTGKTTEELRDEAIKSATETADKKAAATAATATKAKEDKPNKDTNDKSEKGAKEPGFIKKKLEASKLKIKNTFAATKDKASAAMQSIKSGEALELGKEKFADGLHNAMDFARQHAKAGYALAFTTFMVLGFGLFFVPTLIMFIIGGITLAIFNKQKMAFFANT